MGHDQCFSDYLDTHKAHGKNQSPTSKAQAAGRAQLGSTMEDVTLLDTRYATHPLHPEIYFLLISPLHQRSDF